MKFRAEEQRLRLRVDPSLGRSLVSLKTMMKTIRREGTRVLVEIHQKEVLQDEAPVVP